jgi:prophage antirepressor-like protein
METNLQVFYNEESNVNIRMEEISNQPWFIAKDVCTALELSEVSNTVKRLDDDEKLARIVFVSGQGREMWFINESGLYNLIFQSRKPNARAFRKWVTNEVLPKTRQPGQYRIEGEAECMREQQQRKRLPLPKYRPFFEEWKQRVKPYISQDELEDVAAAMGVGISHVRKVYAGTAVSARVVREITDEAKNNRKHNTVYSEPVPVHEQMCIQWDEEDAE